MRTILTLLVLLGLAAGGVAYYNAQSSVNTAVAFRTEAIQRDDLLSTISASGTVQPEEVIDIGAQVVGRIKQLGADPDDPEKTVDYCSKVHPGMVLAWIDEAVYKAQVIQAEAQLERSKADLLQLRARCDQTEQEWKRAEGLLPMKAIADTDYDLAVSNYKAAKANVAGGEAIIRQNEAALELARTNLAYTVIKSPVEGLIIDRRVNVGQTVVSSMNAPSLFLIAKDLKRLQIWASVNEADIGRIRVDMPVRFTVDAFPGEVFHGRVSQIRLNATMSQNVVTYTVVVAVDICDLRLLPYLTANLQFEIERREGVLLVPNAALRWKPRPEQMSPPANIAPTAQRAAGHDERGRLWTVDGEQFVRPIEVTLGPTDGLKTEVGGPEVREGMKIVVGMRRKDEVAEEQAASPFIPQFRRGRAK